MAAGYFAASRDLGVSLVLVLPLLVAYLFGIILLDFHVVNGADIFTRAILPYFGVKGLVVLALALIAAFIVAASQLGQRARFRPSLFVPLLAESTVYASLLGTVIVAFMRKSYLLGRMAGPESLDLPAIVVLSIGAGVNEELLFRLIGMTAFLWVGEEVLALRGSAGVVFAVIATSLLFAGAHHVGAYGEPFRAESFIYRTLAGVIFAAIYRVRSFAVAVYTHAIYDILVLAA
jgi:hypothetical protein